MESNGNTHRGMVWPPPPPGIVLYRTTSKEVLNTDTITDKTKEALFQKKVNARVMRVGDTILATAEETAINENLCLLDNKSTFNAFIKGKYLSNIRNDPDRQYLRVHCNTGVTYTKKIGDLPEYSNPIWYNPEGIVDILSLVLVQKHHIMTYNSQDGNEFVDNSPHRPTLKITKAGILYHSIRHLIKNKNAHIMVNEPRYPIPKVE